MKFTTAGANCNTLAGTAEAILSWGATIGYPFSETSRRKPAWKYRVSRVPRTKANFFLSSVSNVFEATAGLRWIAAAGHRLALQGLIVWHTIRRESHSSPMNRNYERPTTGLEDTESDIRSSGLTFSGSEMYTV
ncbi:uncharacterized protein [Linepithema humile]|uniref:uncharacterized protein isoform X2 n=1 Tax=Linepithema humile TaxID=83485 RepID=UPI0006234C97|nr:PREDICTED: uncharacterized protein LOC105667632 isoform X2 [Linepithema humile]